MKPKIRLACWHKLDYSTYFMNLTILYDQVTCKVICKLNTKYLSILKWFRKVDCSTEM